MLNRGLLVDALAEQIADGMDHKDMYQFVTETLADRFDSDDYELDELIELAVANGLDPDDFHND